jgi:probable rRNA maturation factor
LASVRTLKKFFVEAKAAVRLKGIVSVLLTTDPAIRRLNKQFRGKNKATDVLSFPSEGAFPGIPAAQQIAGDLAISVPTALRQAMEQGHSLTTEVKVLMLHGLLHLSGLDHESDTGQMARREEILRGKLKLPQGLIERVEGAGSRKRPSGAQARMVSGPKNVRAKARTLQTSSARQTKNSTLQAEVKPSPLKASQQKANSAKKPSKRP